ncbi:MAG: aryl-sulfate sulfotransferase [Myxococcota bacterium]
MPSLPAAPDPDNTHRPLIFHTTVCLRGLLLISLLACEPETPSPTPIPLDELHVSALEQPLSFLLSLHLSEAAALVGQCEGEGDPAEVVRFSFPASLDHVQLLQGFRPDTHYQCQFQTDDPARPQVFEQSLVTAGVPEWLEVPILTVPPQDPASIGYTLYNYAVLGDRLTFTNPALVILDPLGQVRWLYEGVGGGDIDAHMLPGEGILFGGATPPRQTPPSLMGLDQKLRWVATSEVMTPYEDEGSYNHTSALTHDGEAVLALTVEYYEGWRGFMIREVERSSNTVRWYWSSIEHGVMSGSLPAGSESNSDPYHANAVVDQVEDGETYYYLSLSRLDRVLKIRRSDKAVVWQLGIRQAFQLLEADFSPAVDHRWFFGQHDLQVKGNRLSLYDNGTDRDQHKGQDYSRVLELELDELAQTARIVYEYTEPGWNEPLWGGYDPLPEGGGVIAMAHCGTCATDSPDHLSALVQVNTAGEVVWRVDFRDSLSTIYRSSRIDGCQLFDVPAFCSDEAGVRSSLSR